MCREASKIKDSHRRLLIRRNLLFFAIASLGCLIDLISKSSVFRWLGMPSDVEPWWLIPRYVGIQTSLNTGALFGMGQGGVIYLAIFSIFAFIGIVIWFIWAKVGKSLFLTWVLGFIAGGILGNLYDRLGLWSSIESHGRKIYAVRDWILLQHSDPYRWPNFNIADSLLVCGAALLFFHSLRSPADSSNGQTQKAPSR